jgi:hypothetical protein
MIGVNQIAVTTVGQVFIAKSEINFLACREMGGY